MLRRTRGMEGPFIILNGEDMLYPQYDLPKKLADALEDWRGWAAEEAFIRLLADSNGACPSVPERARALEAAGELRGLPSDRLGKA